MEIEGKVILDLGETSGTSKMGNPWKKHEYVLETFGQYPRKVKYHIFGARADEIRFEIGKNYKIQVDVESREFNGRWYTDVSCYAASLMPDANGGMPQGGMDQGPFGGQLPPMPNADFGAPGAAPAAGGYVESNDSEGDLPF